MNNERRSVMANRIRCRWPAMIAAVCLALTGCTADEPDVSDTAESSTIETDLPGECSEWTDPPTVSDPIDTHAFIGNAAWEKVDGYLWFEATWVNTTDLVAVGVSADLRVFFDGTDITEDLPSQEIVAEYNPYSFAVLEPGEQHRTGEINIDLPPSPQWSESGGKRTELHAEPTIERWCLPAEDTI